MESNFFEVTVRKVDNTWIVLTVLPNTNTQTKAKSLQEALDEAAKVYKRLAMRYQ